MRVLIFDSETTGLPNWKAGYGHICQPDVIQLAMILIETENNEEINSFSTLVRGGRAIDPGAEAIHGISQSKVDRYGLPRRLVLSVFHHMVAQADLVVCHNTDFDIGMMHTAYIREGITPPSFKTYCTMKALTPICKLPHKNPNRGRNDNFKWPKLIEAYKMFIDEEGFDGAHDALVDVRATYEMLKWLGKNGHVPGYNGEPAVAAEEPVISDAPVYADETVAG